MLVFMFAEGCRASHARSYVTSITLVTARKAVAVIAPWQMMRALAASVLSAFVSSPTLLLFPLAVAAWPCVCRPRPCLMSLAKAGLSLVLRLHDCTGDVISLAYPDRVGYRYILSANRFLPHDNPTRHFTPQKSALAFCFAFPPALALPPRRPHPTSTHCISCSIQSIITLRSAVREAHTLLHNTAAGSVQAHLRCHKSRKHKLLTAQTATGQFTSPPVLTVLAAQAHPSFTPTADLQVVRLHRRAYCSSRGHMSVF